MMEEKIVEIKEYVLPLIPLRGMCIFPNTVIHFDVGREKSIHALEEAMVGDQYIFLAAQKDFDEENPEEDDIYQVGTIAKIKQLLKMPGNVIRVLIEGKARAMIKEFKQKDPFLQVLVEKSTYNLEKNEQVEALQNMVMEVFQDYMMLSKKASPETLLNISRIEDYGQLSDIIVENLDLGLEEQQEILEIFPPYQRLESLYAKLLKIIEKLKIEKSIDEKVKSQLDKVQKEYYLREKLHVIQEELGESQSMASEIEDYRKQMEKLELEGEVKEKLEREFNRLAKLSPGSVEIGLTRTYIEWVLDLPWNIETEDNLDIKNARKILDEDHYALQKVKERILEYLAVLKLSQSMKGPILCLVGPPGVGKTSIAKSIARALNRKFVRMSLGGIRDEAEIRGHRRTYVGAMPGRIIYSMKQAGSKNPLFLLDEIDKMSQDFRGDPAAALLEVLDTEQNYSFRDHYLELPFDLSKVMFITTANSLDTIPRPLLDRMEVIYISGYTEEEKLNIAKKYLFPKQLKSHGLKRSNIRIKEETIRDVINYYTRESGVRNLERQIATLCRKGAKEIVENNKSRVTITNKNLNKFLGIPPYRYDKVRDHEEVGMVTGLAWTAVGGVTLEIEAVSMPGNGKLQLTGQLGDVMKESAQTGVSYIRSMAKELGINEDFYKNLDIHLHIPEGAIPKDGPSAGITMTTAILSLLTHQPVPQYIAMTGEITLTGRVLPVGGIKEKVLAAHRAGITTVILPKENERDLEEIEKNVRKNLQFILVENMKEVIKAVF
ncbi:ATP-dependent proteinase. Serine peptidase. MEROPS family S16 [Garciella nitratireducens DSM 15102]|uniref:Lon protease n=2 Tax=Garciella TaxID=218204 RepID=A0A1T4PHP8_9FIRM|nr:endopeptidase La [Garciella nitratireducens]RBP37608.1 ATP-dependent proteinase [Garciella nitratireducens]SJZ91080.1 ATP-dependent proteinase. Serine peptidase. MEROPS family S16 [Garciella nitratireducens DSM 15102]